MTDVTIIQSGKYCLGQAYSDEGAFGDPLMVASFAEAVAWGLMLMVDGGTMIYTNGDRSGLVDVSPALASPVNTQVIAYRLQAGMMTSSERCTVARCIAAIDGPTGSRF